jgi:O-antigen/teichoic acid export membrane protein
MSQYAQGSSRKELKKACLSGLKYMTLLAIPVAVLVTSLATPIIRLISGSAYEPAGIALQFLIWGTSLYFLNTVFFYTFIAANLQRRNLLAWGIIGACTLVLTIILIPYFDFKGAAIAVVLSLLAGFFTYVYTAMRMLIINPWRLFVKCFIAGIIMELIVVFSKESHLIAGSIFAFGLYIFTIIFLKVLNKEDYTIIRGLYARST